MTQFTSNIMKVGAHLDDTRVMLDVWDPDLSDEANVEQIIDGNLLGLPSQSRANDVMVRALRPRFIAPNMGIIQALQSLLQRSDAFRDACYFELTRIDALVARLSEGEVRELILAVGSDVEGEATANYLAELMRKSFPGLEVSRLAQGLPAGGGLENADELTLYRALDGRRRV